MKKLITFLLSGLFLITTTQTALAFYSDVPETHEYYNQIKTLYDNNLLPTPDDNTFNPDKKLTLIDLYELIFTYGKATLTSEVEIPYSNIDETSTYAPLIQTAINYQLLTPTGESQELDTEKTVTKGQALSTMFKTLGIGVNYLFDKDKFSFTDIEPDTVTAAVAMKSAELNILEPENPTLFKMAKRVSKAEFADYLYKVYTYQEVPTINVTINSTGTYSATQQEFIDNENFPILLDVWEKMKTESYYKDTLNDDELITSAIKGMVEVIDDEYTSFQDPQEADNFFVTLSNEYEGIGMTVEMIDNNITVVSPFNDSPAEKAGLKPNDIIIKVDNEDVNGLALDVVVSKIKGPAGTDVKLTILRNNEEKVFTVTREKITYTSVEYETESHSGKKIGYISLNTFGDGSYEEFVSAATELIKEKPAGFIIDLRNNPGGYLDTAISITSLFTDEITTAVKLEYSSGKTDIYKTDGNGLLKDYKVVVLVNEGSASASEILAGALKDLGIAKLIGTKTFGKGSVQQLASYTNGSMFKYTISKWLTPNGTNIDKSGITPNKTVENAETSDKQLEAALDEF